VTGVAEKPRLLVIDRDSSHGKSSLELLSESFTPVTVRTISKALALLRDQSFDAVYVDASQLSAVRWVGMMIQAEEILDAISDGVAVVRFIRPSASLRYWGRTRARSRRPLPPKRRPARR
jgi:hypothetical protein